MGSASRVSPVSAVCTRLKSLGYVKVGRRRVHGLEDAGILEHAADDVPEHASLAGELLRRDDGCIAAVDDELRDFVGNAGFQLV